MLHGKRVVHTSRFVILEDIIVDVNCMYVLDIYDSVVACRMAICMIMI